MIEGCFYTEETDQFFTQIEEGRVYWISKAEISEANKKFTAVKHDYRLIFKLFSVFEEVSDQTSKAAGAPFDYSKNLIGIREIRDGKSDFTVDVCGIVKSVMRDDSIKTQHSHLKVA